MCWVAGEMRQMDEIEQGVEGVVEEARWSGWE